jgi:hypothetical protein
MSLSMERLWNMILEVKMYTHETRSMSINAFDGAEIKFNDLSHQVGNIK